MTATLEAIDTDRITADRLGFQGMAYRRAFVNHLDAVFLESGHPLLRVVTSRLDDADTALDDGSDVARIVRGRDGRQEGQVHAERLICQGAATFYLTGQQLGCALCQAGDYPESPGVGDRSGQLREADVMHATLDDGVLDFEQFGDARLHMQPAIRCTGHSC
ncbi:hypothetical protein D3C84_784480 [compost metagenome]